jgi:hypothetical protein
LKSKGVTAAMRLWRQCQVNQTKTSSKSKYKEVKNSSKKVNKPKLIRAMLDSGSDEDLLFHKWNDQMLSLLD